MKIFVPYLFLAFLVALAFSLSGCIFSYKPNLDHSNVSVSQDGNSLELKNEKEK